MKINKILFGFLLLVVFVVLPTESDNPVWDTYNGGVPLVIGLAEKVMKASPLGPYLIAGLSFLHVLTSVLIGSSDVDKEKLTKLDLEKTQKAIIDRLEKVDSHITESTDKIIRELSLIIRSDPFFESMRIRLESFDRDYANNMHLILNPRPSQIKRNAMESMINYNSDFRKHLGEFITTYIAPTVIMPTGGRTELFFDFVKEKDQMLARDNKDCNKDSLHYKIFKSFLYIAKGLINSYNMALAAHVLQYKEEISQDKIDDANGTKEAGENLLREFKNNLKKLISTTKFALETSSREIKNCGAFNLEEGTNCARLSFATAVVRYTMRQNYAADSITYIPPKSNLKCNIEEVEKYSTKAKDFIEFSQHNTLFETDYRVNIYYDPLSTDRIFSYANYDSKIIGRKNESNALTQSGAWYHTAVFYGCYHNKAAGISMQRVHADSGNVITGVRFRVENNILYIDIQQAKYVSDLEVDPSTVVWKKTPEDPDQVAYLSVDLKKIEIADHMLYEGDYLTAVQLQKTYMADKGIIKLFYEGSKSPTWCSRGSIGDYHRINETNEVKLEDRDDPKFAPANVNRLISSPPDAKKPAYLRFQITSIKKDLGRTTIPYIDTREVVTDPPSPVAGIGMYHEAASGDGGLLALKLIAPNLSKYMDYSQFENFAKPEQRGELQRPKGRRRNKRV